MESQDTIAAVATPSGEGGIGVIRVSGPATLEAVQPIAAKDVEHLDPRKATLVKLHPKNEDNTLDRGILTYFPSPNSYTGEDVLEISCHGSPLLLRTLLQELLTHDVVRMAKPGEFTRRAFEHDKLDLAQADAVASLISARSEAALRSSARQLEGELSAQMNQLRENLLYCQSRIEAGLDFGDQESVGDIPFDEIEQRLLDTSETLDQLIQSGQRGKLIEQGCNTSIVGRPNVGKSSLMNTLLRNDRAIVTPQPGTTRDVISDQIVIDGIPFKLHDTAGIRPNPETIESEGIERSKEALEQSDLVLFLIDRSEPLRDADRQIFDILNGKSYLLVSNKIDRPARISQSEIQDHFDRTVDCEISAKTEEGLDRLRERMVRSVERGEVGVENPLVTQTRHLEVLNDVRDQLQVALKGIRNRFDPPLIAEDLREAAQHAGRITGEISTDDLLDEIFSSFCIGK